MPDRKRFLSNKELIIFLKLANAVISRILKGFSKVI